MPPPPVGDWADLWAYDADPFRPDCRTGDIDPNVLHRARAGYYGHMSHIDHQLNRFIETLRDFGVHENTWLCFTSDHGELMGDHHLFRKAHPYEGSTRVPMLLMGPRGCGLKKASTSDAVLELRDVMPTLLEIAGAPVPATVEGKSFLRLAKGEGGTLREFLHGEHTYMGQSIQWLTDGHEKYVWLSGTGREQLFDLDRDPQECHDLASHALTGRLERWRGILVKELAGREEGFTDGTRLITGRPVSPVLSHVRAKP
jgi:arylsulfatase A-like enzyme